MGHLGHFTTYLQTEFYHPLQTNFKLQMEIHRQHDNAAKTPLSGLYGSCWTVPNESFTGHSNLFRFRILRLSKTPTNNEQGACLSCKISANRKSTKCKNLFPLYIPFFILHALLYAYLSHSPDEIYKERQKHKSITIKSIAAEERLQHLTRSTSISQSRQCR